MRAAAKVFQTANRLNPTSFGRSRLMDWAQAVGAIPVDGIYDVGRGVSLDLKFSDFVDRAIYYDAFEFMVRRVLERNLRDGSVFLDVGSNIGYYYAVESNPATLNRLYHHISINDMEDIQVVPFAAADQEGSCTIYMPEDDTHGLASLRNQGWAKSKEFTVPMKRLDEVLASSPKIDVIKIDIEGAELLALKGANKLLRRDKPMIIAEIVPEFLERFGHSSRDVLDFLLDLDSRYRVYEIKNHAIHQRDIEWLRQDNRRIWGNFIFSTFPPK
jgi:FkbM family methyltransferase